jgi:hypothetical protein
MATKGTTVYKGHGRDLHNPDTIHCSEDTPPLMRFMKDFLFIASVWSFWLVFAIL